MATIAVVVTIATTVLVCMNDTVTAVDGLDGGLAMVIAIATTGPRQPTVLMVVMITVQRPTVDAREGVRVDRSIAQATIAIAVIIQRPGMVVRRIGAIVPMVVIRAGVQLIVDAREDILGISSTVQGTIAIAVIIRHPNMAAHRI